MLIMLAVHSKSRPAASVSPASICQNGWKVLKHGHFSLISSFLETSDIEVSLGFANFAIETIN